MVSPRPSRHPAFTSKPDAHLNMMPFPVRHFVQKQEVDELYTMRSQVLRFAPSACTSCDTPVPATGCTLTTDVAGQENIVCFPQHFGGTFKDDTDTDCP